MIIIELSKKKKKNYWRPFVEYLADIVVYFYLQNPYGKKKKKKKTREMVLKSLRSNSQDIPYTLC